MTLGLILLILAIILALIALAVADPLRHRFLAGAVLALAFAVWLGVPALSLT